MNIIVVQSLGTNSIKNAIEFQFGKILTDHILYTESFDEAVELFPKRGKLFVVTSDMFHDEDKEGGKETKTIPHKSKSADTLARFAKQININAKICSYSEFVTKSEMVDYVVKKGRYINKDVVEIFKIMDF